jgi:hypothetical protein
MQQHAMMTRPPLLANRYAAVLLAMAVGPAVMVFFHLAFWWVAGHPGKNLQGPIFLRQAAVISVPFLLIALRRASRQIWIVLGIMSAALYGYYLYDEIRCTLSYGRTASNSVRTLMVLMPFVMLAIGFVTTRKARELVTA